MAFVPKTCASYQSDELRWPDQRGIGFEAQQRSVQKHYCRVKEEEEHTLGLGYPISLASKDEADAENSPSTSRSACGFVEHPSIPAAGRDLSACQHITHRQFGDEVGRRTSRRRRRTGRHDLRGEEWSS